MAAGVAFTGWDRAAGEELGPREALGPVQAGWYVPGARCGPGETGKSSAASRADRAARLSVRRMSRVLRRAGARGPARGGGLHGVPLRLPQLEDRLHGAASG